MSVNRRQHRQAQRDYERHARVVDWHKIKAQLKSAAKILPLVVVALFILVLGENYYDVHSRNAKRQAAMENPTTTTAIVTEVFNSKNSHYAIFKFSVGDKIYKGQTFYGYNGHANDEICVTYNTQQPSRNIYCEDTPMETFKDDILMASIKLTLTIAACFIVILPLFFLLSIINGDKQTIAAVTNKKHK